MKSYEKLHYAIFSNVSAWHQTPEPNVLNKAKSFIVDFQLMLQTHHWPNWHNDLAAPGISGVQPQ